MSAPENIVPPAAPPVWRRVVRVVAMLAAFAGGAAAVCAALRPAMPFPGVEIVTEKYRHYTLGKNRYDALFVGTSTFFHGVLPREFDAEVAARTGQRIRSFNFGADAMWPPESIHVLRELLALRPQRLRWVFFEVWEIDGRIRAENSSRRTAYWHDVPLTALAVRSLDPLGLSGGGERPGTMSDAQARVFAARHAELLFKELVHYGRAGEMLGERLGAVRPFGLKDVPRWLATEGYVPGPSEEFASAELASYELHRRKRIEQREPVPMGPVLSSAIQSLAEEVRAAGATPIFVVSPTLKPALIAPPGIELWEFSDPAAHADLFDTASRYDSWHLNAKGSALFSRQLAARFSERRQP